VPAAVVWWYFGDVVILAALPLALSAWVIVLKYAVRLLQNAEEYYYARKEPERWVGGVDFGKLDRTAFSKGWGCDCGYFMPQGFTECVKCGAPAPAEVKGQ
jgi:hypothetical protein